MSDPFQAMRIPPNPVDPDPAFASRLRERINRAFDLPKGVTVSNLTAETITDPVASTKVAPAPAARTDAPLRSDITPYLAVAGARQAIEWYSTIFDGRLRGDPIVMPDGRIGHAEIQVAGGVIMLSEEHPEIDVVAPVPGQGASVTIHLEVADVDAIIDRAVAEGARLERAAADYDYGRNGVIRDPFGHRWMISGRPAAKGPRHGDIGYVSLWVPDAERAAAFFEAVLGWQYRPAVDDHARQVEGLNIHHGIQGGVPRPTLFLCFAVDDVDAAVSRVSRAGGTADEPTVEPYGRMAGCVDDQGVRFAVFEPPGGTPAGAAPAPNGGRHGDLAYLTMEVVDSARSREFYGAVLGWRFQPGHVEDGWTIEDVSPMTGVHGGDPWATTLPMYRVDDIDTAVRRVRDAGGTATDPEVKPYGVTSECTDDQGTRFYLGRL